MRWAIQNSGIRFDFLDRNVNPLAKALDENHIEKISVGLIPGKNIITGIENIDFSIPTIFYGSTTLVETIKNLSFKPGVWFEKEWFDPRNWVNKRDDFLNDQQLVVNVGDLKDNFSFYTKNPVFIKSIESKILSGMVLEGNEDYDWWNEEYNYLKNDDLMILCPVHDIIQEWRFFIINGQIISGSQYKHDHILRIKEPISDIVWNKARKMSEKWMPSKNIVMDICLLKSGEFKVLEWNCVCSSGFYNSDISSILKAINIEE